LDGGRGVGLEGGYNCALVGVLGIFLGNSNFCAPRLAMAQRVKTVIDRETFANALLISIRSDDCQIVYQKSNNLLSFNALRVGMSTKFELSK
jgi:hypothetical protein